MGTLPAEVTSFVGRRRELADARVLLGTSRLLTLTGPGGVGKTRLALRLAAQVRRTFPDGVWFVELASVEDPDPVARAVSAVLGLRDTDNPAAELAQFLQDRSLLLVLDNCEHLVTACAHLVARLLQAAPGIRVLATSRQVLGVEGEHLYAVPPMTVGDQPEDVVKLFADRAVAVAPDFRVDEGNCSQVVEICRQLDGIPLAVELAAAWVRVLPVDHLLAKLDDRFQLLNRGHCTAPDRQRTLEATVAWSYDLCSPDEQGLWARLSVFQGFDLQAAEAVSDRQGDVLDLLARLVDKSIVQSDSAGRFHHLETIRRYGLDKLGDQEHGVRRRHRDHYLRLAEQWSDDWRHGLRQIEAQAWAGSEHANLRSALDFSLGTPGEHKSGLRLAVALHFSWLFGGHAAEGRRWLEQALDLNPEPSKERAKALGIASYALSLLGYASTTYSYAREAEAWARDNGDQDIAAHTVFLLGSYYFLTGELEKSLPLFRTALGQLQALDPTTSFVRQLHSALAQTEIWLGRPDEGRALACRGLELCEDTGEQYARSALLFACALSEWMLHRYDDAAAHLVEGIRLAQIFNDVLGAVTWLELLCWTTAARGRYERAAELLGVTGKLWPMGGGRSMLESLLMADAHETCERDARTALGSERYQAALDRGAAASTGFGPAITYALGRVTEPKPREPAVPARDRGPLSTREYQVAQLVADGLSNKDIALRLIISRRTAESHVVHILDKLGFKSRSQIASWLTALNAPD